MLGLSGCERAQSTKPAAAPTVCTTFYPTTYFAQRIASDLVNVTNPCPADADPAFWMPSDEDIAVYQQAKLIIINGASFEKWLDKVTLPEQRLVDTTKPLEAEFIMLKDAVRHKHGPAGEHTHEGVDGHTWLDPVNATLQATEIKRAFDKAFPEHVAEFQQNYDKLVADLEALDQRFQKVSEKMRGEVILCNHPAYNYIGRRYQWDLKTFHLHPDEMPGEEALAEIKAFVDELKDKPAKRILWEGEPLATIAEKMNDELGIASVVFSPCEALDAEQLASGKDFLSVMKANADRLEKAFGQ